MNSTALIRWAEAFSEEALKFQDCNKPNYGFANKGFKKGLRTQFQKPTMNPNEGVEYSVEWNIQTIEKFLF